MLFLLYDVHQAFQRKRRAHCDNFGHCTSYCYSLPALQNYIISFVPPVPSVNEVQLNPTHRPPLHKPISTEYYHKGSESALVRVVGHAQCLRIPSSVQTRCKRWVLPLNQ